MIPQGGREIPPYFRMRSQTRMQGQLLNVVKRPSMMPWSFMEEQKKNTRPAIEGMFDTLCKRSKLADMSKLVSSNKKLQARVASDLCSSKISSFETSNENVLRSIACYYSGGVMGKRKYKSVRLVLATKASTKKRGGRTPLCIMQKTRVPKLLPYDKLMTHIKQVDIGKVSQLKKSFLAVFLMMRLYMGVSGTYGNFSLGLRCSICRPKQNLTRLLSGFQRLKGHFW